MAEANRPSDSEIFDGGPPLGLEKSLGLIKPNQRRSVQRALLALLIVWAPLFVLSAIESLVLGENKLGSLISDLTVLSRYLIVVPLSFWQRKVRFLGSDRSPAILSTPES